MKKKLITTILFAILFLNVQIVNLNYNNKIEVSNVLYMTNNVEMVSEGENSKNEDTYIGKLSYCGAKENKFPAGLPTFTSNLVKLIQFLVPVVLIIFGIYDFAMAVIASDEKKMKDSSSKFVRRLIAGVLIFLVTAITKLGFGLIDADTDYLGCVNCFLNNKCNSVAKTYSCYQCNSDTGIYKWKTSTGSDSDCGSGYHKVNGIKTEKACNKKDKSSNSTSSNSNNNSNNNSNSNAYACYRCNNTGKYKWSTSTGSDSDCPSGYTKSNEKTKDECNKKNSGSNNSNSNAYACYQCSTDPNLHKWSNDILKDNSCSGEYIEIIEIKEESKCHG